ncbi:hypothetical protein EON65_39985 [archaeon]|nr:MAG: hypothetical protein EON65_39985 [archaeon]
MDEHLNLLKYAVTKPLALLKREVDSTKSGSKTNSLLPECDAVISDIVEESTALDAQCQRKLVVRRVFVRSEDGGLYNDVGWLLLDDVEACMLCKKTFGMFLSKFSCHACGNVFCTVCCNELAFVFEIQQMGKLLVCNMCCYGQVRQGRVWLTKYRNDLKRTFLMGIINTMVGYGAINIFCVCVFHSKFCAVSYLMCQLWWW